MRDPIVAPCNVTHAGWVFLRQKWPRPDWLAAYWASRWWHARWYGRRHR